MKTLESRVVASGPSSSLTMVRSLL